MPKYLLAWGFLGLVLAAGCGVPARPNLTPVRGEIYRDGVPVRYGRVHLEPAVPGEGIDCWGNIGPDGTYVLRTYTEEDGAAPGEYKVWIEPYSLAVNGPITGKPTPIPPRYQSPETSELTVTITPDTSELEPLHLKP